MKAAAKREMFEKLEHLKLEIREETPRSWLLRARFDKTLLESLEATTEVLRLIKNQIFIQTGFPPPVLEFGEIIENRNVDEFVISTLRVQIGLIESGKPQLIIRSVIDPQGIEYKDMIAQLLLFPLLEDNSPLTPDAIRHVFSCSGLRNEFINQEKINQLYLRTIESNLLQSAIVAEGRLPVSGENASMEYMIDFSPNPANVEGFAKSLRVHSGQLLCKKIPRTHSEKQGVDLFGRSINGVGGLDIELEAQDGAAIASLGLGIYAQRDGLAEIRLFEREMLTTVGPIKRIYKVSVAVAPVRVIIADNRIDYTSNEAIEIHGNLKSGSKLTSTRSIFIDGNVEEGGVITSGNNIIVKGNIDSSNLVGNKEVIVKGSIRESSVIARSTTKVGGSIKQSRIFTEDAVEIQGNLSDNSMIIASNSILINGEVGEQSQIESSESIMVKGAVSAAKLTSDKHVVIEGMVSGCEISAKDRVVVSGTSFQSHIVADTVFVDTVSSCVIDANKHVKARVLSVDESTDPNEIHVGTKAYSSKRIEHNEGVISNAEQGIKRLQSHFGDDVMSLLESDNVQAALLRFIKQQRVETREFASQEDVMSSRRLLEAIKPARNLINTRRLENILLQQRIEQGKSETVLMEITEAIEGVSKIDLNGSTVKLTPENSGSIMLTNDPTTNQVLIEKRPFETRK